MLRDFGWALNFTLILSVALCFGGTSFGQTTKGNDSYLGVEKLLESRTWIDVTGEHKVEASFSGLDHSSLKLQTEDGRSISVPIDQIGDSDQENIQSLRAARRARIIGANLISDEVAFSESCGTGDRYRDFPMNMPVVDIAFSPDGRYLAVAKRVWPDGDTVTMIDFENSKKIGETPPIGRNLNATKLAFSPDGSRLFCGTNDGRIFSWAVDQNGFLKANKIVIPGSDDVTAIAATPEGGEVLCGIKNSFVQSGVDVSGNGARFFGFPMPITAIYLTRDGNRALATDGILAALFDLESREIKETMLTGANSPRTYGVISLNGRMLASKTTNSLVYTDLLSGEQKTVSDPISSSTPRVDFSPSGRLLFDIHASRVNVWDTITGTNVFTYPLTGGSYDKTPIFAVSPCGRWIAVANVPLGIRGQSVVFVYAFPNFDDSLQPAKPKDATMADESPKNQTASP